MAASTKDREIVITRVIDAPRELIWDAWTDPKKVVQWWGPDGFTTTTKSMEVRKGGRWEYVMHGPDGVDYPDWQEYLEVVKPERLVYDLGTGNKAEFRATITFEKLGRKTKITMHALFPTAEARDHVVKNYKAIEGGQQTLGRLAAFVEAKH